MRAARLQLFRRPLKVIKLGMDIKPSKILVTQHDDVAMPKLIDFGIAKATTGQLTDKTLFTALAQFIGTPAYMSREQAQMSGLDVDTRSDIYSLGVLLYELLTGKTPFAAMNQELQAAAGPKLRLLPGPGFPLCQERRTRIVQGFQKEQLARFESCAPQTGHQPRGAGMHSPPPFVICY